MSIPVCKRGHAQSMRNVYMRPNGVAECRLCRSEAKADAHSGVFAAATRRHRVGREVSLHITTWGPYFLVADTQGYPRLVFNQHSKWMPCGLCAGWVEVTRKPVCPWCGR